MSVNDKIFDRLVSHMADVRLYEEGVQLQNRRIIKRHRLNLKDLLTGNIRADVTKEVSRFATELNSHNVNSIKQFSTSQLDFHTENLYKEVKNFYKMKRPKSKELLGEIIGPTMKGSPSLTQNIKNISSGELIRIQSKVKAGLARGASPKEIIADVLKTTKITEFQAKTLTRTAITATQTLALKNVVDDNKEIVKGYLFSAILDSRTSPICSYHNGKVYEVDDKRFVPPLHWNCRSSLVPVLKSKEELEQVAKENVTIFGEAHTKDNVKEVEKRIEKFNPKVVYHEFYEDPQTIKWAKKNNYILRPGDLSYKRKSELIKKYGGATEQFQRDREEFMYSQIVNADKTVKNAFLMGNDHAFDSNSVIFKDKTLKKIDYRGKVFPPRTDIDKTKLNNISAVYFDGVAPVVQGFTEWLRKQDFDVQIKMLGSEERAKLFRGGAVQAREFVTPKGKALSIEALRRKASEITSVYRPKQRIRDEDFKISASKPSDLIRSPKNKELLKTLLIRDADNFNSTLSLTDYRGVSLTGKAASRRRVGNQFDERNFSTDPLTGEIKNTNLYDPDFNLYQERIDFMRNSKILKQDEKDFIESVVNGLDDKVSLNQQTVIVENLRVVFERYARNKEPWKDFSSVLRAENRFAVQNVSRLLDTRSRERSEMFVSYLTTKQNPQVQIMGKYYDLDELQKNLLKDQRYIDKWRRTEGKKLAYKIYFSGRAPLRVYFRNIVDKYPDRNTLISGLRKISPAFNVAYQGFMAGKKVTDTVSDVVNRGPSDSWITKTFAAGRENIRQILDAEFLIRSKRPTSAIMDEKALDSITKVAKLISSGQSTDYDALAINIGKQFAKDFENIIPLTKHTVRDYHKEGSAVLDLLKDQGYIRVQFRGKTRRGVIDLETGRESGGWGDTISREVVVVNKELIKLQEAERRTVIARRLGVTSNRDRLYVKAGYKTYFDARGNNTNIPIVSRNKFADYDEKQIDRDMANMLNHVMSVEYTVDNIFVDFMDDVVRFRDPRGNSKYFDGINEFRHEILARGEQGYGLMATAKYHRNRQKNFTTTAYIDSRGRVYHRGYLTPTGGEVARPFLNSGKAKPMNEVALEEIRIQMGAMIGPGTEALTQAGRKEIFLRNEANVRSLGSLLLSDTQRDRRIREFLEHPLIKGLEGKEVPKMARMALEYERVQRHLDTGKPLNQFQTRLMIENDASSSGAQIIALSTGDRSLAESSNVLATTQKNRLYDLVALDTINDPEFRKIPALRDADLTWEDLAKAAKYQNMVGFYGAGAGTKTVKVSQGLESVLEKKGYLVVTKENLKSQLSIVDKKIKEADRIGATSVKSQLEGFRAELIELVNKDVPVGRKLLKEAQDIHPDVEDFVKKFNNSRKGLVGPKDFSEISRIMSKNMSKRAPVTDEFINFWKEAAVLYVNESNKVDIPWVTFDGKVMTQQYRPTIQERIEFTDPVTGRRVANIYETSAEDGQLLGKGSLVDARIGLGVNGNHSNDATIVRQFHLWGRKNGVGTATIHDAFFTNVVEADRARNALRTIYADALEGDTIRKTLKEMRKQGLSRKSYNYLLSQAKERGLIDPKDKITRKDVLAPISENKYWYGIGP